jgi:hypothetical protein
MTLADITKALRNVLLLSEDVNRLTAHLKEERLARRELELEMRDLRERLIRVETAFEILTGRQLQRLTTGVRSPAQQLKSPDNS